MSYSRKNLRLPNKKKYRRHSKVMVRLLIMILTVIASFFILGRFILLKTFGAENSIQKPDAIVEEQEKQESEPEDDKTVIVIDAGHGDHDSGCLWGGVSEKDINLDIALCLQEILKQNGFEVIMTRTTDEFITLEERAEIANENNADLFISIHQNASEDTNIHGIEVLYDAGDSLKDSFQLAESIQNSLVQATGGKDRGTEAVMDTVVLRDTNMTSCLVECGYLSNKSERESLKGEAFRQKTAQSIAKGIIKYLQTEDAVIEDTVTEEVAEKESEQAEPAKVFYLTFDDGPHADTTPAILDILARKNIKATFFLVGSNVERYPEITKRIVEEGHTIGVHCYNHTYEEIYQSADAFIADFVKASDSIEAATGVRPRIFRFPGGSINAYNKTVYDEIVAEMGKWGYVYYDWNGSLEDSVGSITKEQLLNNAISTSFSYSHIVMLAHDTIPTTAESLNELIDQFDNYEFKSIQYSDEPVQFRKQ